MTHTNTILKIGKPCSQDWNAMHNTTGGKFCDHCSKSVTDFSKMSDEQIIRFLEHSEKNICGRLTRHQLDRVLSSAENPPVAKGAGWLAGLMLFGAANSAIAQQPANCKTGKVVISDPTPPFLTGEVQIAQPPTQSDNKIKNVRGIILDATTNEPLPFANIYSDSLMIGVMSDMDGKFELRIPYRVNVEYLQVTVSFIGFDTRTAVLNVNSTPADGEIKMERSETILTTMGALVIIEKQKRWWQFWK